MMPINMPTEEIARLAEALRLDIPHVMVGRSDLEAALRERNELYEDLACYRLDGNVELILRPDPEINLYVGWSATECRPVGVWTHEQALNDADILATRLARATAQGHGSVVADDDRNPLRGDGMRVNLYHHGCEASVDRGDFIEYALLMHNGHEGAAVKLIKPWLMA